MPADGSGTDLKHGGSSLPDLTNFKIEPNPSANNFVHMSGGTCSTIKVEEPDQGSPYSSVRKSYNYYLLSSLLGVLSKRELYVLGIILQKKRVWAQKYVLFFSFFSSYIFWFYPMNSLVYFDID